MGHGNEGLALSFCNALSLSFLRLTRDKVKRRGENIALDMGTPSILRLPRVFEKQGGELEKHVTIQRRQRMRESGECWQHAGNPFGDENSPAATPFHVLRRYSGRGGGGGYSLNFLISLFLHRMPPVLPWNWPTPPVRITDTSPIKSVKNANKKFEKKNNSKGWRQSRFNVRWFCSIFISKSWGCSSCSSSE